MAFSVFIHLVYSVNHVAIYFSAISIAPVPVVCPAANEVDPEDDPGDSGTIRI